MSCTNETPCKQPMLRWVHSDRCKELTDSRRKIDTLCKRIMQLEAQLPEEMKDCTIIFKKCALGHGWLTAKNWADYGCFICALKACQLRVRELEDEADIMNEVMEPVGQG